MEDFSDINADTNGLSLDDELQSLFDDNDEKEESRAASEYKANEDLSQVITYLHGFGLGIEGIEPGITARRLIEVFMSEDTDTATYDYVDRVLSLSQAYGLIKRESQTMGQLNIDVDKDLIEKSFKSIIATFPPSHDAQPEQLEERDRWVEAATAIIGRPDALMDIELGTESSNDLLDALALEHIEESYESYRRTCITRKLKVDLNQFLQKSFGDHDNLRYVVWRVVLQAMTVADNYLEWDESGFVEHIEASGYHDWDRSELEELLDETIGRYRTLLSSQVLDTDR